MANPIGVVEEFWVDPEDGQITHLVLPAGHLWGSKVVPFPVSEIDRIAEKDIYLKLDTKAIARLLAAQVRRKS
jgi:hypothetical protein